MLLYHGTSFEFSKPSLKKCKPHRDFGCGFYLAKNYSDALPMAIKNSYSGFVQTYELTDTFGLNILYLNEYSDEWLAFVVQARLGVLSSYDLVVGNMAGGGTNLKSKFSKYRNDGVSAKNVATIMRTELTNTSLGIQYAFLTLNAISRLVLLNTETIEREDFYDQK